MFPVFTARSLTKTLVEEGLNPGETVVVYPSDALRDGARVRTGKGRHAS